MRFTHEQQDPYREYYNPSPLTLNHHNDFYPSNYSDSGR
ncbi:hypothetical protein J2S00_003214 [Caldalkalibacillus uzonensis]|uniref:Uncharacterized protein n=1 Tax=Caldalkalibacillus uzonensis TaxID=353224 RepID=A0ABU0CVE9_9BACI|nr:hypothetical protein [Caldalkalibacillus uzonensis]